MSDASNIGLFTAFVAGLISFISPCVLPLVPGYLSYVAGRTVDELRLPSAQTRVAALLQSIWFVLGFSTVFVLLGASATTLGRLLLSYKYYANWIGGIVVIVLGLFMTGLFNLRWLHMDFRLVHKLEQGGGPLTAYILGLAFAFGWTPCIGPILGGILTVSASSTTVNGGVLLLASYSLGLGLPFLAASLFLDRFLIHQTWLRRWGKPMHVITGVAMMLMGVAMVTGQLTKFSYWLLETFPQLGNIG